MARLISMVRPPLLAAPKHGRHFLGSLNRPLLKQRVRWGRASRPSAAVTFQGNDVGCHRTVHLADGGTRSRRSRGGLNQLGMGVSPWCDPLAIPEPQPVGPLPWCVSGRSAGTLVKGRVLTERFGGKRALGNAHPWGPVCRRDCPGAHECCDHSAAGGYHAVPK